MINHRAIAKDLVAVCNTHKLNNDQATKLLIYTATKLLAQRFNETEECAAELLSKAALAFRDELRRINRMLKNRG